MFSIYLIEREDGLKYVGQTKHPEKRFEVHNKSKRFSKYKIKSFIIVDTALNREDAFLKEKYWIEYYDTFKNGLNMTNSGGYNHKNDSLKFTTIGMSYTKGTKWYNNGIEQIRVLEGNQPPGFIAGRISKPHRGHSEKTKREMSLRRKGKVHYKKYNENNVREALLLYKSRPIIEDSEKRLDAAKSLITTYERAFCKSYSKQFGMTTAGLFNIIKNNGGLAWNALWKEIFGDEKIEVFLNKKRKRFEPSDDQIKSFFKDYLKSQDTKKNFCKNGEKYGMSVSKALKLLTNKSKWGHIWEEVVNENRNTH